MLQPGCAGLSGERLMSDRFLTDDELAEATDHHRSLCKKKF